MSSWMMLEENSNDFMGDSAQSLPMHLALPQYTAETALGALFEFWPQPPIIPLIWGWVKTNSTPAK